MPEKLLEKFPNAKIVLTLGEEGSVYIDRDQIVRQGSYRVKAVDTTAAGDTFTGYFIAGVIAGKPIREVLDTAAKASAIAVTREGAAPSVPSAKEVNEIRLWSKD